MAFSAGLDTEHSLRLRRSRWRVGAFGANLALEPVCWELLGRERHPAFSRREGGVLERREGKPLRGLRLFASRLCAGKEEGDTPTAWGERERTAHRGVRLSTVHPSERGSAGLHSAGAGQ